MLVHHPKLLVASATETLTRFSYHNVSDIALQNVFRFWFKILNSICKLVTEIDYKNNLQDSLTYIATFSMSGQRRQNVTNMLGVIIQKWKGSDVIFHILYRDLPFQFLDYPTHFAYFGRSWFPCYRHDFGYASSNIVLEMIFFSIKQYVYIYSNFQIKLCVTSTFRYNNQIKGVLSCHVLKG